MVWNWDPSKSTLHASREIIIIQRDNNNKLAIKRDNNNKLTIKSNNNNELTIQSNNHNKIKKGNEIKIKEINMKGEDLLVGLDVDLVGLEIDLLELGVRLEVRPARPFRQPARLKNK